MNWEKRFPWGKWMGMVHYCFPREEWIWIWILVAFFPFIYGPLSVLNNIIIIQTLNDSINLSFTDGV